ncbi:hypothetical protein FRC01_013048 [Tulasnella sp. 417]|nr:hypothetical protein FRC01_013048 [Tulasnella sp. 417]
MAETYRLLCKFQEATASYLETIDIFASFGETHMRAHDEAVSSYSGALEIFTRIGDEIGRADVLCAIASVHLVRCKYAEATSPYSEALEIFTRLGDNDGRDMALCGKADTLIGIGGIHFSQGRRPEALSSYLEAITAIYTRLGDENGRAGALYRCAEVHHCQEDYRKAESLYVKAAEVWARIGKKDDEARALERLVNVRKAIDDSA